MGTYLENDGEEAGCNHDRRLSTKHLRFKLNRNSLKSVPDDSNCGNVYGINAGKWCVNEMKPNSSNLVNLIPNCESSGSVQKRKYKLSSDMLQKSVFLSAFMKRNSVGCSVSNESPKSRLDKNSLFNISLTSCSIDEMLSANFDNSVLNSTVDGEESEHNEAYQNSYLNNTYLNSLEDNDCTDTTALKEAECKVKNEPVSSSLNKDNELEPMFAGYQLVGDSQLLRFAQNILGLERKYNNSPSGSLGLCVSGQRISELHNRVLDGFYPVGRKLILLIGTNDLTRGARGTDMCRALQSLLHSLYKYASKIIILTLPPAPKYEYLSSHWYNLKKYNSFIFSLTDRYKEKIVIADVSPLFYHNELKKCNLQCFELWFGGQRKKSDLIHINKMGFKLIRNYLLKECLKNYD